MKNSKINYLLIAILAIGLTLAACSNETTKANKAEENIEKTELYACPMHSDMTGEKGDECSMCGMKMTPMSGDDHKGHNH